MRKFKIGEKVQFEYDRGKLRVGKVVNVNQQPGWDHVQYQIEYRGSLSWRRDFEVSAWK